MGSLKRKRTNTLSTDKKFERYVIRSVQDFLICQNRPTWKDLTTIIRCGSITMPKVHICHFELIAILVDPIMQLCGCRLYISMTKNTAGEKGLISESQKRMLQMLLGGSLSLWEVCQDEPKSGSPSEPRSLQYWREKLEVLRPDRIEYLSWYLH